LICQSNTNIAQYVINLHMIWTRIHMLNTATTGRVVMKNAGIIRRKKDIPAAVGERSLTQK